MRVGTACVLLSTFLPSLVVPVVFLIVSGAAAAACLVCRHYGSKSEQGKLWRVDERELILTNEVLGRGANGEVRAALYELPPDG